MIRIAAIRVNFCLLLLSNGISVGIGYICNTMHVYHDTIITWVTADSFCSLFPYPLHNPRYHTCNYVTHVTVNGSGVTSRKVRYGSRDFKVTRKKPAVRHIHVLKLYILTHDLSLPLCFYTDITTRIKWTALCFHLMMKTKWVSEDLSYFNQISAVCSHQCVEV
jgi:hypothetical protein